MAATKSAVPFSLAVTIGGVDVTSYVRLDANIGITRWRQDEDAEITASQCGFELDNSLGYFTPGATSGPLANAVVVDAVVQVSQVVNGVTYYRFTGFVDEWDAQLEGGVLGVCTVTATDAYGRAGVSQVLRPAVTEELMSAGPAIHLWPLSDGAFTTAPADVASVTGGQSLVVNGAAATADFTKAAGFVGDVSSATCLSLSVSGGAGNWLTFPQDTVTSATRTAYNVAILFRTTVTTVNGSPQMLLSVGFWTGSTTYGYFALINSDGTVTVTDGSRTVTSTAKVTDGAWHGIVVPLPNSPQPSANNVVYLDGVSIGTWQPALNAAFMETSTISIGVKSTPFSGDLAYVGVVQGGAGGWGAATTAFPGETTGARLTRLAGYRGFTVSAPTTFGTVGPAEFVGQTLQQAARDVGTAEGTVTYIDGQGRFALVPQTATWNPTPAVTLDATTDPITADYSVRLDRQDVLNDVTVQRPGGTDQRYAIAATVVSQKTIAAPLPSDAASLALAQWTVNAQSTPQPRSPSFTVDLMNLATTAKVQALLATTPLSAVQVTNLPSVYPSPANYLIQGEQEAIGVDVWTLTCFTSPVPGGVLIADNPATWVDGAFGAAW